jgi:hypothetical protein
MDWGLKHLYSHQGNVWQNEFDNHCFANTQQWAVPNVISVLTRQPKYDMSYIAHPVKRWHMSWTIRGQSLVEEGELFPTTLKRYSPGG